jgi:CMP-N-acetylneuraminic acid synthetase
MKWTAIIPARDGSQGLPRKNLCTVGGIPLYMRAVTQAIDAGASKVIISTNIPEILDAEFNNKISVINRPNHLSGNLSKMSDVIKHACETSFTVGTVVLLQPTSPLRQTSDIKKALDIFSEAKYELVLTITDADSSVLKYGFVDNGRFLPVVNPDYCFSNRQDLPRLYKPNGAIYIFDAVWFLKNGSFSTSSIGSSYMDPRQSIDIDSMADLILCNEMLRSGGVE